MEALGEHCYEKRAPYGVCGGILGLVFIIIFSISWDTVEPTEFGLLRNTISGAVNLGEIYENGRFVVGPAAEFIHFPRNRITLSYGARETDDRTAIPARTGPGEGQGVDSDSGGQPLDLSISFQYLLVKENIPVIYSTYASSWEASYLRFAQQAITNVAQEFNPSAFWRRRAHIEAAMLVAVNQTLFEQGYATAVGLQLRSVGFQTTYEQTITNIQLQEQLKVTKSYQQEVIAVEKQVDLTSSETAATIRRINAEASRQSAEIVSKANADALQREQDIKGQMYAKLKEHLGWSPTQFLQYIKQKALNAQPDNRVLVGVNAIGQVPGS